MRYQFYKGSNATFSNVANHISGYRGKARDNHDECLHTHQPSSLSPLLSRVVSQSASSPSLFMIHGAGSSFNSLFFINIYRVDLSGSRIKPGHFNLNCEFLANMW
jgi:hypothetical protein